MLAKIIQAVQAGLTNSNISTNPHNTASSSSTNDQEEVEMEADGYEDLIDEEDETDESISSPISDSIKALVEKS